MGEYIEVTVSSARIWIRKEKRKAKIIKIFKTK